MAPRRLLPLLGIWTTAAFCALLAQAGEENDVGGWPVFRGDARASGVARDALPSDRLDLLWTFSAVRGGFKAAAAVVAGTVYAADTDGNLYAIDLASGGKRWTLATNSKFTASPAVRHGRVYVGDYDGRFHCLDGKSGKVVWQFEADARIYASANFYGDCVLFGARDAFVYCLAADSGKLVWKYESPGEVCSIAVGDGRVFFAGDDHAVHVLDPRQGKSLGEIDMRWPTACVPALMGGVLFVGNEGGSFVALDPRQKKVLWSYDAPEAFPSSPPRRRPPRRSSSVATTSAFMPSIRRPAGRYGPFAQRPAWTARRSSSASGCSSARRMAAFTDWTCSRAAKCGGLKRAPPWKPRPPSPPGESSSARWTATSIVSGRRNADQ